MLQIRNTVRNVIEGSLFSFFFFFSTGTYGVLELAPPSSLNAHGLPLHVHECTCAPPHCQLHHTRLLVYRLCQQVCAGHGRVVASPSPRLLHIYWTLLHLQSSGTVPLSLSLSIYLFLPSFLLPLAGAIPRQSDDCQHLLYLYIGTAVSRRGLTNNLTASHGEGSGGEWV